MNKSDLKKEIKNYIYEILSEDEAYELTGATGNKTVASFKSKGEADKFKQQNPNIKQIKKLEEEVDKNEFVTEKLSAMSEEEFKSFLKSIDDLDPWNEMRREGINAFKNADERGNVIDMAFEEEDINRYYNALKNNISESDDEKEDTWNKEDKEDRRSDDKEPSKAELAKEKVKTVSKFKVPNSDFEDFKTRLKTLVKKIKDMEKGAERDKKMAALKQFIKKPELVKAFKERDVQIDTGGLVGENKTK